jgi:hypothetical protein
MTTQTRLVGVNLLPADQRAVFAKLPDEFKFSQVEQESGQRPKTVAEWLRSWQAAGVVEHRGEKKSKNSRYVKTEAGAAGVSTAASGARASSASGQTKTKAGRHAGDAGSDAGSLLSAPQLVN